jgi:regulator of sigma E protease
MPTMDDAMQSLMDNTYFAFALIVIGFGFLIFVHELGHFLVAKMVGVKTTQFAIGFGQSLLTWRKGMGFRVGTTEPEYEKLLADGADPATLGETEYRLNYIPLGGYVKMLGQEDMDPSARSEDPRAFNNKSVSARFAVISAGVIMNVIFGMIFFVIAFMSGVKFPPAIVGAVVSGSPAATTYAQGHDGDKAYLGLRLDDHITHIDGKEAGDMLDVKYATILARGGSSVELSVERDGEAGRLTYLIQPKKDKALGLQWIGIDAPTSLEVAEVTQDSAIESAGVSKGMVISAVGGEPVNTYGDYHRLITGGRGTSLPVTFSDPSTGRTAEVETAAIPRLTKPADGPLNLLGLVPPTSIELVIKGKPAEKAGIQPGDVVAAIGDLAWPNLSELQEAVKSANGGPVTLTVLRDGEMVTVGPITPKRDKIGVGLAPAMDVARVSHSLPSSSNDAGSSVVRGSRIVSVNDQPVHTWGDLQRLLSGIEVTDNSVEVELRYEVNLPASPLETVTATVTAAQISEIMDAGWIAPLPEGMPRSTVQQAVVGEDPLEAVSLGFVKTHQFITQTYMTLLRLFEGTVPADKLSGPVGIVHQGTIIAERGWGYLLFFMGLISVNLAVINFLPIPITDGGQAVFLAAEKIKGSPVSVRVQTAATVVGLALLACVFLYVTFNDVLRLLGQL